MPADQVPYLGGRMTTKLNQFTTLLTRIAIFDDIGILLETRNHLAIISARCPPSRLRRFQYHTRKTSFRQMNGGREASEARPHDDDIGCLTTYEMSRGRRSLARS
jgi:hypothetical protein